jgi:hypothetical protein
VLVVQAGNNYTEELLEDNSLLVMHKLILVAMEQIMGFLINWKSSSYNLEREKKLTYLETLRFLEVVYYELGGSNRLKLVYVPN